MKHSRVKGHPYNFRRWDGAEPFAQITPPSLILPEVDPRGDPFMPLVFDQGQLGSCTANAVEGCFQYAEARALGRPARRRSRLDIYYGERVLEGQPADQDTGAYGHDGFRFLQQTGALLEKVWPYDTSTFAGPPPAGNRWKLRLPVNSVAQSQDAVMAVLSNRQTIAFGFTVYESFEYQQTLDTGVVPMPGRGEQQLGGHEVLIVGYLEAMPGYALVRNSWGADIYMGVPGADVDGGGYFLMPWQYVLDAALCSDFRTISHA
jgi:C1A family cysteine protease